MLKKITDWVGPNLDVYKVEHANDIGTGLVRHIWQGEQTATQIGTTLNAQIMNNLQKGLVHYIRTSRIAGTNKDIYAVNLNGIDEFGIFSGLKLLLQIDNKNQYDNVVLKLNEKEYPLYRIKNGNNILIGKGNLRSNSYYLVNFYNNSFYLIGNNIFGTEEDTTLEGKKWLETIGLDFGGYVSQVSNKEVGKAYINDVYDNKLYVCTIAHNSTVFDITKYRDITNGKNSERLENLSRVEEYTFNINGLTFGRLSKVNKVVTLTIDSGSHFYNKNAGAIVLNIPEGFKPRHRVYFNGVNLLGVLNSFILETDGNLKKMLADSRNGAYYLTITYLTD